RGRTDGRGHRRRRQRRAAQAAGRAVGEDLPRDRPVEGSRGGSGRARYAAGDRGGGAGARGLILAAAPADHGDDRPVAPRKPRMSQSLQIAESRLLLPAGLDAGGLERAFGALLGPGIDFGDLYFQHSRRESWTVEDGIVKDGAHAIEQGVGVRAIAGEKTGFAYSDDINAAALLEAAGSARAIARAGDATAPR